MLLDDMATEQRSVHCCIYLVITQKYNYIRSNYHAYAGYYGIGIVPT